MSRRNALYLNQPPSHFSMRLHSLWQDQYTAEDMARGLLKPISNHTQGNWEELFQLSRRGAELVADEIEKDFPEFFDFIKADFSLRPHWTYLMTYQLARRELPLHFNFEALIDKTSESLTEYFNSHLSREQWKQLVPEFSERIEQKHTSRAPSPLKWSSTEPFLPKKAEVLLVLGRESDLSYLDPIIEHWPARSLAVFAKKGTPEKWKQIIFARYSKPVEVYPLNSISAITSQKHLYDAFFDWQDKTLRAFSSPSVEPHLRTAMNQYWPQLRLIIDLIVMLRHLQPKVIAGCFEKTPLGPLLGQKEFLGKGCKTVNFQHGLISITRTLDLMSFDQFFVWNSTSQKMVLKDGYDGEVTISGKPIPAKTSHKKATLTSNKSKEKNACLVFPQPIKAPMSTSEDKLAMIKAIKYAANKKPDQLFIVKLHPQENETDRQLWNPESLPKNIELRDAQIPLEDLFEKALCALSVNSAALIEATDYGLPTASFDPRQQNFFNQFGFDKLIGNVTDSIQLLNWIDSLDPNATPKENPKLQRSFTDIVISAIEKT